MTTKQYEQAITDAKLQAHKKHIIHLEKMLSIVFEATRKAKEANKDNLGTPVTMIFVNNVEGCFWGLDE